MAKKTTDKAAEPKNLPPARLRLIVVALLLLVVGVLARRGWDNTNLQLASSPQYKITAEVIRLTPAEQPAWIRTDVKAQVLRDSGLGDSLSLLDTPATIQQRLIDAFELHPWVKKVDRVDLASPREIDIVISYRKPIAVVEVASAGSTDLLPLDADAMRLPDEEFTDVEKSYLPRITGILDRPRVGEAWSDLRVQGAARLAAQLSEVWDRYSLLDIVPSEYPEVQRSHRFFVYDVRASGGTVIHWGAAPGFGPPAESSFVDKLARLTGWIQQNGTLDSINSPESIDVRDSLHVEKRIAKEDNPSELVR